MKPGKPLYPLVSGIGLVVVFLICSALLAFHPDINKDHIRYLMDHSRRVLGYRITDSREALFRISPQDKRIELLSNLDLTSDSSAGTSVPSDSLPSDSDTSNPDTRKYALEIRILNSRLEPIHQDTFHEVTRVTQWVEPETGNLMKSAFYLYEDTQACDSRITSFDLPVSDGEERFVAVRLLSPKRASASIRAYRHLDLTAERDIKGLRLMPKSFRTKLARHNLYGEDLSAEELARSMTDVLSQIPAETRQGFEYTTRQLFLFDDIAPMSGNLPPANTSDTSLTKPVFFAIDGPASLTVELDGTGPVSAEIWLGNAFLSESERTPDSTRMIAFDFAPGRHLLKLQDPAGSQNIKMVNLDPPSAWTDSDQAISQPFPVSRTAYYRALPPETAAPVRIDLPEPPADNCRMVKLVCRLPLDSPDSKEPVRYSLSCHYIAANGSRIEGGVIDGQCTPSSVARYDLDSEAKLFPSMPERWHILPPAEAVSLEISATRPVDIALFSRLDDPATSERVMGPAGDISHIKDVGYRDPDSGDYYFRPLNAVELAADNRKTWITIPAGLVESSQTINDPAGNSTAVSCYPDSGTSAVSVFEPASGTADDAIRYIRFNPDEPVKFTVDNSVTYIRPGFMYRLEPGSNPMISVKVDNLVITRFRPVTFEGYFEIPPVSTGTHTIQVSCSDNSGQIFMKLPVNVSCNENQYNLRQAFRLDPGQSLSLPFHKPSWDAAGLNILAYRHHDSLNPVSLRVEGSTMSGSVSRPISARTQPLIRFTGNQSPGPAQVLTRSGQTLTSPERFHYRMQDDQKPDTYTVTIESQTDTPVYLRFFTMTSEAGQPS